jgi:phage baseplate assembly protein W
MANSNISLDFPFKESPKGYYLNMTTTDSEDVRSSLMHLLLTNKGERFMMPEFGTNLIKYIFEPKDSKTITDLKLEISEAINKFIPNLQLNDIIIEDSVLSEYMVTIKIDYTATDGLYSQPDTLIINM